MQDLSSSLNVRTHIFVAVLVSCIWLPCPKLVAVVGCRQHVELTFFQRNCHQKKVVYQYLRKAK